jgi:hypothetical protein
MILQLDALLGQSRILIILQGDCKFCSFMLLLGLVLVTASEFGSSSGMEKKILLWWVGSKQKLGYKNLINITSKTSLTPETYQLLSPRRNWNISPGNK